MGHFKIGAPYYAKKVRNRKAVRLPALCGTTHRTLDYQYGFPASAQGMLANGMPGLTTGTMLVNLPIRNLESSWHRKSRRSALYDTRAGVGVN